MRNITENFKLGFGSFVDKTVSPYVRTEYVNGHFLIIIDVIILHCVCFSSSSEQPCGQSNLKLVCAQNSLSNTINCFLCT